MTVLVGEGIIFDGRNGRIIRSFRSIGAAKGSFTKKYSKESYLKVCTYEEYQKTGAIIASEMVEVKSVVGNKMIKIRREDVGTCCDPSTERYWAM